jgi:hypothetical protein
VFKIGKTPVSFVDVTDDRNDRPLTIAFATIVAVWSIAIALTLASERIGARGLSSASGGAIVSIMSK